MMAGTHVCEISKGEIENKCEVVSADCNLSTKLSDFTDSDSSYCFADEVAIADPVESFVVNDVEIQADKICGDVDCCLVESDCFVVGKSNGGEVADDIDRSNNVAKEEVNGSIVGEVVEPIHDDCQVTNDKVVEIESSPKAVESVEYQVSVFEGNYQMLESNLDLVESQMPERKVILEASGSGLQAVEEVGEVKSKEQPESISNGQVDESDESHLESRSVAEYEKKLEEENKSEIDNQEYPVPFTSEVQCDLRPEKEAADLAIHGKHPLETEAVGGSALIDNQDSWTKKVERPVDKSQMGTQLSENFEGDQVLPSSDPVQLEVETVVDPASDEDQVSRSEAEHVLQNQKDTQLNEDLEDSLVLSPADLVRSGTENETEVPLETVTVSDPATNETKDYSESEDVIECVNDCLNDIKLNRIPQNGQILSSTECEGPETENKSEVPPGTEIASDPTPSENQVSQIEEVSECIGESQEDTHLNKGPEVAQTSPVTICVRSETMDDSLEIESDRKLLSKEKAQIFPSSTCVSSESENKDMAVENSENFCAGPNCSSLMDKDVGGASPIAENIPTFSADYNGAVDVPSSGAVNPTSEIPSEKVEDELGGDGVTCDTRAAVGLEIRITFGSFSPRQKGRTLWCDDMELEVPNGDIEPTNGVVNPTSDILAGSVGGMETVLNSSEKVEDELSGDGVTCDKAACMENVIIEGIQSDGLPTTLPETSTSDTTDGQDVDTQVITRPFNFLIKIPRFQDDKLSEKIRHAQVQVEEKTQQRDVIRAAIQNIRTNCQAHGERFEAAKAEERKARWSVKLKRQEIDSLQPVINRVKNAISVEEINKLINGMEHMMHHETLPLKEEKEFIREIKRLKHLQEELSSNIGSQDEVLQALAQRDQNEDHLKIGMEVIMKKLKKELEALKDTVLKAEVVKIAASKKYDEEIKRLTELQTQFKAANDTRQEEYEHLSRLRGQLYAKNKNFGVYKDDAAAANGYASRGDKEALHRLCDGQVEQIMELWNTDDEFRKEYVRCNMRSTVRRLRTLDGRSLGPDDDPPAYVDERVSRRLVSVPNQTKSILVVADVEQVSSDEEKQAAGKILIVAEPKIKTANTRETAIPVVLSGSATVSGRDEKVVEDRKEEEEKIQELAWKAEEEIEAKERRRLEEKTKAKEALERKKKKEEKTQKKAELRAQKEAQERDKEREKRLRKKEKKKSGQGDVVHDNNNKSKGEDAILKESEEEVKESIATSKKGKKASAAWLGKQSSKPKPIPPTLLNRGKRRMQQWLWIALAVLIIALFLFASISNPKLRKHASPV